MSHGVPNAKATTVLGLRSAVSLRRNALRADGADKKADGVQVNNFVGDSKATAPAAAPITGAPLPTTTTPITTITTAPAKCRCC
jgi:hypothetical protein